MTYAALNAYGWTPELDRQFAPWAREGLVPGRILLEHNHLFRVVTPEGEQLAEAAGRIKHLATARRDLPVVGDWVGLRPAPRRARAQIRTILPRHSSFSRKAAGRGTEEQVLAANVDAAFLVFGLDVPVNPRSIERYLLLAQRSGAAPIVVLNKADLVPDPEEAIRAVGALASGVPVRAVSTRVPDGLEPLMAHLAPGRTVALLGPSGVGKSSIVNALAGEDVLRVGEVRDWDQRGRHTSVHRQLVPVAGGSLLIDTPGMRELQPWDVDDVSDTFEDVAALAPSCRFRDCLHDREPGCAVKAAVDEGRLDRGRYANFLKLERERLALEQRRDERVVLDAKRQARIQGKALKTMQKKRGR